MTYTWIHSRNNPRQHWLFHGTEVRGLVYAVAPANFTVYGENFEKNPFARTFLAEVDTLDEAKDLLLTVTASQEAHNV